MRFSYIFTHFRYICTCISLLSVIGSPHAYGRVSFEEETIRVHTGGWTDLLEKYHKQTILHLLDLTKEEFGPYQITFIDKESPWLRVQEEIAQGRYAHMEITAEPTPANKKKVIHLPFNNLRGLLGLRRLIIRKESNDYFSNVESFADFKKFRAGQVVYWPDNRIYENANIPLAHSIDYKKIFPMLDSNRFDYLPLGILEADDTLATLPQYTDRLSVQKDVYIFYPLKTFISVSIDNVPLVDRLVKGLVLLREKEQQASTLFNNYFKSYINKIDADNAVLIVLNNPDYSLDKNETTKNNAIQHYFSSNTRIINP